MLIFDNVKKYLKKIYKNDDKVSPDCMNTVSDAAKQEGTMKLFTPNVATNVTAIRSKNRLLER